MAVNPMGKSRKVDAPYLIIKGGGWEWRVLKAWQADPSKMYARWFVSVSSPHTFGGSDTGDSYVSEIAQMAKMLGARITYRDPAVTDDAIPAGLR
jgi:hypothetical protein